MKCPFCDADMKDGQVFCESCGKEIHLVPLYEPNVEETMQSTINDMVEGMLEVQDGEQPQNPEPDTTEYAQKKEKEPDSLRKKICMILAVFGGIMLLTLVILLGVSLLSEPKDFGTYLQDAKNAYSLEKYTDAIENVNLALLEGTADPELLEEAYLLMGRAYICESDVEGSIRTIKEGIRRLPDSEKLYRLWIQIEQQREDYGTIARILSKTTMESLLSEYAAYICNAPRFDTEAGTYEEVVYLKLMDDGAGKIYYTINGTEPTVESDEYISPIKLENGTFEIKAVFVNNYGVKSDVSVSNYQIDIAVPDEPEVSLESGVYHEPRQIDVFVLDDTYSVYYTTDGSIPDLSSSKYEGTLLLPFGKSHYNFIMYDADGVASDVAMRDYEFILESAHIGIEQARILLMQRLIAGGTIMDMDGHVAESGEIRLYSCDTAFNQDGQFFYLFVETAADELNNSIRTGNLYGVNVMNGEVYRARHGGSGGYYVEGFD